MGLQQWAGCLGKRLKTEVRIEAAATF